MADQINLLQFLDTLSPEDRNKAIGILFGFIPARATSLMKRTSIKISNLGTAEEITERVAKATGYPISSLSVANIAKQIIETRDSWLTVSALTEPYKQFLERQLPKTTADKYEELIDLGRFIVASALNFEIVVPEKPLVYPDFLVRQEAINMGIEHTRLIDPQAKARIKIVQQFIENTTKLLQERHPEFFGTVNVFIDFNQPVAGDHNFDNKKFTPKEREMIVNSMADYIYAIASGITAAKPAFVGQVSYVANLEPRLDISLGENYISKDGFEELLLARIQAKEQRFSTYMSFAPIDKCWLLVVTDGVSSYSGFDLQTTKFPEIETTNFDAIVLLEAFSHKVFWIKKPVI